MCIIFFSLLMNLLLSFLDWCSRYSIIFWTDGLIEYHDWFYFFGFLIISSSRYGTELMWNEWINKWKRDTYAQAYLEALRLPVNSGDSSARNLIKVLTLSASPVSKTKTNWKLERENHYVERFLSSKQTIITTIKCRVLAQSNRKLIKIYAGQNS